MRSRRILSLCSMVLVLCAGTLTLAADNSARYNDLGLKIQCACGCGQQLIKCNHIGCQYSDAMIRQLRTALVNYPSDEDVFNWFRRNYGVTVVISPATHGFELMIWVVPPVLVAMAFLLVFFIIRRWRLRTAAVPVTRVDPKLEALRARARKETQL